MKVIRYAIRKADLHSLLHSIGVLHQTERLLAVNNLDLTDQSHDVVIVTVTSDPAMDTGIDPSKWSDEQVQNRFAELAILEEVATRQLQLIVEELYRLREFKTSRQLVDHDSTGDIPDTIERHIRDQIRRLLSGEEPTS